MRVVVHVRHQTSGLPCPKIVDFRIDPSLPLQKVMKKWCSLAQVKLGTFTFRQGTHTVLADDKPCDLGWGNSVFVDVISANGATASPLEDDSTGLKLPRLCYTLFEEPDSPTSACDAPPSKPVSVPSAPAPAAARIAAPVSTSLPSDAAGGSSPSVPSHEACAATDNPAALPRKRNSKNSTTPRNNTRPSTASAPTVTAAKQRTQAAAKKSDDVTPKSGRNSTGKTTSSDNPAALSRKRKHSFHLSEEPRGAQESKRAKAEDATRAASGSRSDNVVDAPAVARSSAPRGRDDGSVPRRRADDAESSAPVPIADVAPGESQTVITAPSDSGPSSQAAPLVASSSSDSPPPEAVVPENGEKTSRKEHGLSASKLGKVADKALEEGPGARVRELMEELDSEKPWNALAELERFDMSLQILALTGVGKKITALEKSCRDSYVKRRCGHMLQRWRKLLKRDNGTPQNKNAPAKDVQASMHADTVRQRLPDRLVEGGLTKKVAVEVEEGLYQLAEQQAEIEGVKRRARTLPPAYKDLVRRVLTSLRENPDLYKDIGVRFRASRLGEMPAHWLLPRERQLQREQHKKENLKQVCSASVAASAPLDLGVPTQDYECPKCGSFDCAYKSDQRSWHKSSQSDDTITLMCRQCNHRWHKD